MNSPSAVKALTAPMAALLISVGRTIEQTGDLRLRKMVGSGMISSVSKSSPPNGEALSSGNTNPFVGSVRGIALLGSASGDRVGRAIGALQLARLHQSGPGVSIKLDLVESAHG